MTSIVNQVTWSLCTMEIDEMKWKEPLVSTSHIQPFVNDKDKIAINNFEMIFNACPKKSKTYKLKNEKRVISGKHVLQRNCQKKTLINCAASELIIQN